MSSKEVHPSILDVLNHRPISEHFSPQPEHAESRRFSDKLSVKDAKLAINLYTQELLSSVETLRDQLLKEVDRIANSSSDLVPDDSILQQSQVIFDLSINRAKFAIKDSIKVFPHQTTRIDRLCVKITNSDRAIISWDAKVDDHISTKISGLVYELQLVIAPNKILDEWDPSSDDVDYAFCGTYDLFSTSTEFNVSKYRGNRIVFRLRSCDGTRQYGRWYLSDTVLVPSVELFEFKNTGKGIVHFLETCGMTKSWEPKDKSSVVKIWKYSNDQNSDEVGRNFTANQRRNRALTKSWNFVNTVSDEHWFIAPPVYSRDENGFDKKVSCCVSRGAEFCFIAVDLGLFHSVFASHYILGFDSHVNYNCISWILQGAHDENGPWETLHTHNRKDISTVFHVHESLGSFVVTDIRDDAFFRFFRIYQGLSELRHSLPFQGSPVLACTGFEIYGTLKITNEC